MCVNRPDAGLAFRDDRVAKADDINAFMQHSVCEVAGKSGISEEDGDDGMTGITERVESCCLELLTEKANVTLQTMHECGAAIQREVWVRQQKRRTS